MSSVVGTIRDRQGMAMSKPLPIRQATRLINELQRNAMTAGLVLSDRKPERAVLFLALFRHALHYGSPMFSRSALATSLGHSPETVRRQVGRLCTLGYCRQVGRNMHLVDDFLDKPEIVAAADGLATSFLRMADGLRTAGFDVPATIAALPTPQLVRAALDIYLSVHELAEERPTNLMDLYVLGAVTVANAARITHDPTLSLRYGYADTVPPDDLRAPISIRAIAAIDGMPYANIWRHTVAVEAAGLVRKVDKGYFLAVALINSPWVSERSRIKVGYVLRVIGDMIERGRG